MSNRLTVRVLKKIGLSKSEIGAHLELLLFLFIASASLQVKEFQSVSHKRLLKALIF